MKKLFLFILAFVFCSNVLIAQTGNKTQFSAGIDLGYTASDLLLFWGTGIGVSLQGQYFFTNNISAVVSAGYTNYLGVSVAGGDKQPAVNIFSLRGGGRFYVYKDLYVGVDAGMGSLSGGGKVASEYLGLKGISFSYSPQLGYQFKIKNRKRLDVAGKYEFYNYATTDFSAAGVRIAYIF